jgi:probable selenium-dependent hydroxylase accessory protein YqeC
MNLREALAVERGVACVVGAGGKKSTTYALARQIDRAVVTATVRIPVFDQHVAEVVLTDDPTGALEAATNWPLGLVPGVDEGRDDRYLGYDPAVIDRIAESPVPDAVLVKADGARMREFKAPGDREPQVPASADTVLPIVSVRAVGRPLESDVVHRPERVAAITGLEQGDRIEPDHVAAVVAHERGGRKDVPADATVVPVVNKVDDEEWLEVAREVAAGIHRRTDVPRVALTRMTDPDPLVECVRA